MSSIVFTESSGNYSQRTRECVMGADFTVAVMVKPDSPGETLTRRLAGERYAGFDLKMFNNDMDKVCEEIAEAVAGNIFSARKGDGEDYVLNVAGNRLSIFMRSGYSQEVLNRLFCDMFSRLRTKLAGVLSGRVVVLTGGQGGADEAAVVGALANGFPARVHAPAGWAYSGADGVTVYDEAGFKERFDGRIIEAYGILAGNSAGVEGPSFQPMFNNGGPWLRDEVATVQEVACTVKVAFSPEVRSSIFLVERAASVSVEGAVHSFFEYAGERVHVGCLDDSGRWYCRVEGRKGYLLSSFGDDGITVFDSFEAGYNTAPLAEIFRGLVEKAEAERLEVQTGQSRGRGI